MLITKLQTIEKRYKKSLHDILKELFCDKRMTPKAIIKKFDREAEIKISEDYLKRILRKENLVKKIGTYYCYNKDDIKCHKILNYYNTASIEEFIYEFYFRRAMSVGAIQKRIENDIGVTITRQALWKWIYWSQLWARTQRKGFNLGVSRHRFSHKRVAKKIDYAHRDIDYMSIQPKRLSLMKKYVYRDSVFAFGLKKLLLDKDKTHKELARFLDISPHCVKAWCALNNRVNRIYWSKISRFLECDINKIFNIRPTKSQINKLVKKGVSWDIRIRE